MSISSHGSRERWAFHVQKRHAKERGIEFLFSFEEWEAWWRENLGAGWMDMRGRRRGQYVMARDGDQGPYSPGNVSCVVCSQNLRDAVANGKTGSGWNRGLRGLRKKGNKLSPDEVVAISGASGTQKEIAEKFGVHQSLVSRIKSGQLWASTTEVGK